MSYVDPKLKDKFESLSVDLKNAILARDVKLYTLQDLIRCLEDIVREGNNLSLWHILTEEGALRPLPLLLDINMKNPLWLWVAEKVTSMFVA